MAQAAAQVVASRNSNGQFILFVGAGGEIASTFDSPDKLKLGSCKLIEEIMIGEDKLIHFSGVEMGEACTIVLRGASKHLPLLLLLLLLLLACSC